MSVCALKICIDGITPSYYLPSGGVMTHIEALNDRVIIIGHWSKKKQMQV